jgi:hypothetical protein
MWQTKKSREKKVSRSQNISSVVKPREKAAISFFSL